MVMISRKQVKRKRVAQVGMVFSLIGGILGLLYGIFAVYRVLGVHDYGEYTLGMALLFSVLYFFIGGIMTLLESDIFELRSDLWRGVIYILFGLLVPWYVAVFVFIGGLIYILSYILNA